MFRGHHGDMFLNADRKNRMEKVRLDKHLRGIDKDCARNEYLIERQKRAIVNKWHTVSKTTGHSEKALPPEGPHDNVYENCKYNRSRLSEKRLMEWKVRERQLEKFLNQFQPRPWTAPSGRLKPRPSSSRSERTRPGPDAGTGDDPNTATPNRSKTTPTRIRSAKAVLQSNGQQSRKRCSSAVSFSSRTQIITTHGEDEDISSAEEEYFKMVDYEIKDRGSSSKKLNLYRSGQRSLSATALFHQDHSRRPSLSKLCSTEELYISDVTEEPKHPPLETTLDANQVTEKLKSSTKNYEAFVRAQTAIGTKFFVTKDNVVMTNALQHTCRELRVSDHPSETTGNPSRSDGDHPPGAQNNDQASNAETMSVSSVSSEELTDSVFIGPDDSAKDQSNSAGKTYSVGSEIGDLSQSKVDKTADFTEVSDLRDTLTAKEKEEPGLGKDLKQNLRDLQDNEDSAFLRQSALSDKPSTVNCQSVVKAMAVEDCEQNGQDTEVPSVSRPMKKLSIVENEHTHANDRHRDSGNNQHSRRHSVQPLMNPRSLGNHGRSSSEFFIGRKNSEPHSAKTLLNKRRQSSGAFYRKNVAFDAKTNSSSIASAMTVTPLLTKEVQKRDDALPVQHYGGVGHVSESTPTKENGTTNGTNRTNVPSHSHRNRYASQNSIHNSHHIDLDDSDDDVKSVSTEERRSSVRRREMALEQPVGLRPSVSALGTVIKAAMVFSKTARRRTLATMVEENNVDKREVIRKERLRKLQSRASVLSKIVSQFPVPGSD